jgi:hypothetical protein
MKTLLVQLCLCLSFALAYGQSTSLLTWGQVYDYEVGDTFIRAQMFDQPPVTFTQTVIVSKSFSADGDTVRYGIETKTEVNFMGGQPSCCQGITEGTGTLVYTNLNDTAVHSIPLISPKNDPDTAVIKIDSSYTTNNILYNQTDLSFYPGNCHTIYKFGAGLGDTYYYWICPLDGYEVWMEYYHKKNGAMAGQSRDFFTSVKNLNYNIQVILSPNPVKEGFQLQLSETPVSQTYLHVYDALGREVRKEPVFSSKNNFTRNGLSAGIYLWQLEAQGKILGHGKLTYE